MIMRRVVRAADNPVCIDVPGWYCQYFRLTPTSDGTLSVSVTYSKGSWGRQIDEQVKRAAGGYLIIPICRRNETSCTGHS